jgi:hypothetical protein
MSKNDSQAIFEEKKNSCDFGIFHDFFTLSTFDYRYFDEKR